MLYCSNGFRYEGSKITLDGDCVISGLVYRLMTPMDNEEMMDSLNKANDIMNGDSDSDYDSRRRNFKEESKIYDIELKDRSWRNIKKNTCDCDVCSRVRECLDKYKTYETYEYYGNQI